MTTTETSPELVPGVPVLVRGATRVQVGWDPERAVVLDPPAGVGAPALRDLLEGLDGTDPAGARRARGAARAIGLADAAWTGLLAELVAAGLARTPAARPPAALVLLHGHGPVTDLLEEWLPGPALAVRRCGDALPDWHCGTPVPDLVVLADALVTDPRTAADLAGWRVPHLPVLLRDGTGVVGPLVLPGRTGCLRCTDLHRRDLDPDWPLLAAQLLGRTGAAPRATVRATAAQACAQVLALLAGDAAHPPAALGASLTVDLAGADGGRRPRPPHPACGCGAAWAGGPA